MTKLTDSRKSYQELSDVIAHTLADLGSTAPDRGVTAAMFWLMVRMEADNNINQLKQKDGCS
tara:strand:+ start:422 stop:607 length:186 start_codon:yes stop_codon:yes gene_type:complete